jgi:hypothetical protein
MTSRPISPRPQPPAPALQQKARPATAGNAILIAFVRELARQAAAELFAAAAAGATP